MSRLEDTERDAERKPGDDAGLLEQARERAQDALHDMREHLAKAKEHLGEVASVAKGHIGEVAHGVKDNAGEIAHNVTNHAGEIGVALPLMAMPFAASHAEQALGQRPLEQLTPPYSQVQMLEKSPAHLEAPEQRQARSAEQEQLHKLIDVAPHGLDQMRDDLENKEKQAEAIARPKPVETTQVEKQKR